MKDSAPFSSSASELLPGNLLEKGIRSSCISQSVVAQRDQFYGPDDASPSYFDYHGRREGSVVAEHRPEQAVAVVVPSRLVGLRAHLVEVRLRQVPVDAQQFFAQHGPRIGEMLRPAVRHLRHHPGHALAVADRADRIEHRHDRFDAFVNAHRAHVHDGGPRQPRQPAELAKAVRSVRKASEQAHRRNADAGATQRQQARALARAQRLRLVEVQDDALDLFPSQGSPRTATRNGTGERTR